MIITQTRFRCILAMVFLLITYSTVNAQKPEVARLGAYQDAIIKNNYVVLENDEITQRVLQIGARLVAASGNSYNHQFSFTVLNEDLMVNAFSNLDGGIYITTGLLSIVKSEDELAAVLAHEVAHVCATHDLKRYNRLNPNPYEFSWQGFLRDLAINSVQSIAMVSASQTVKSSINPSMNRYLDNIYGTAMSLSVQSTVQGAAMDLWGNALLSLIYHHYHRKDEHEADKLGCEYLLKAGFKPEGMESFLNTFSKQYQEELAQLGKSRRSKISSTHPSFEDRIKNVRDHISKLRKQSK